MTADLHRIVYYSRNQIAPDADVLGREIALILAKSRINNARDGITGALMFNTGCFAQVLEGPLEALEAAYGRIKHDARHGALALLSLEQIETRHFPNWSMGFVGAGASRTAESFGFAAAATGFDPSRLTGSQVLQCLQELARRDAA